MVRRTTYEWIVEEMDMVGGEIVDVSAFVSCAEAKRYVARLEASSDVDCVICLRRDIGEGPDAEHLDIVNRQYAYPGETQFEGGAMIPLRLLDQLEDLR